MHWTVYNPVVVMHKYLNNNANVTIIGLVCSFLCHIHTIYIHKFHFVTIDAYTVHVYCCVAATALSSYIDPTGVDVV